MSEPLDLDELLATWRTSRPKHDGDRHPFGCESCAIERLVAELRTARARITRQSEVIAEVTERNAHLREAHATPDLLELMVTQATDLVEANRRIEAAQPLLTQIYLACDEPLGPSGPARKRMRDAIEQTRAALSAATEPTPQGTPITDLVDVARRYTRAEWIDASYRAASNDVDQICSLIGRKLASPSRALADPETTP